jgi:hypothetical protein
MYAALTLTSFGLTKCSQAKLERIVTKTVASVPRPKAFAALSTNFQRSNLAYWALAVTSATQNFHSPHNRSPSVGRAIALMETEA